jgi:DNA-binding NarL/FixJ family response regulator
VVYAWFHGEVPAGLLVRHLNGNRHDNRLENLAIGDNATNMADAVEAGAFTGDHARGVLNCNAKLTEPRVREIRQAYAGGESQVCIARRFRISQSNVSDIVRRRIWAHVS